MSKYDHLTRAQLIGLLERREREAAYGLVWEREEIEPNKRLNDDFVALDLDRGLSVGEAPWENMVIEGDNFDALRFLRMTHAGQVRCIYIDPPYNTGNRDFVYNDRFFDKTNRFRHLDLAGVHVPATGAGPRPAPPRRRHLREEEGQIYDNGRFEVSRLRWDN
jgi:adenine-specific DNA-methyltransferase